MDATGKAELLGGLAKLLWEAYPYFDIDVGTVRKPGTMWGGRIMTIRIRCWDVDDDDRYFAMDIPVEHGATVDALFHRARYTILDDGPGWIAENHR
jgi:hypothetical protein